jgi:hypothetical protein
MSNAYIHARCPIKLLVIQELGSQIYEYGLTKMCVCVCVCLCVCACVCVCLLVLVCVGGGACLTRPDVKVHVKIDLHTTHVNIHYNKKQ